MYIDPINVFLPGTVMGIAGYFLVTRAESKKWFKAGLGMLIAIVPLIILGVSSDRVYVINPDLSHKEKWHLGLGHDFAFANGTVQQLTIGKDLMVNNSSRTLHIKSVTYLRHSWLNDNQVDVELVVSPYSPFYFNEAISWWFSEPPESITVKNRSDDIIKKYYVVVAD